MILEMFTEDTPESRELFKQVAFGIGCYNSGGMLSENPHAGYYEAETSRTLDLTGGSPACNQGGIAVVEARRDVHKVCGIDCRNFIEHPELYPTLQAKPNGGQSLNFSGAVRVQYIVRRLTPTECARLQGFPDNWAIPDRKEDFTDDEYNFWLIVRNTHAIMNGKSLRVYPKNQTLSWYNKLRTDSSEYKLWGNGLAYPTALYVMEGVQDALEEMEDAK